MPTANDVCDVNAWMQKPRCSCKNHRKPTLEGIMDDEKPVGSDRKRSRRWPSLRLSTLSAHAHSLEHCSAGAMTVRRRNGAGVVTAEVDAAAGMESHCMRSPKQNCNKRAGSVVIEGGEAHGRRVATEDVDALAASRQRRRAKRKRRVHPTKTACSAAGHDDMDLPRTTRQSSSRETP